MIDDIWATVVVALVSIIGIIITQIWSFRSSKAQFVLQTRAGFFQQAYRDNLKVMLCLKNLEAKQFEKESISKITQIVDERPESFSYTFVGIWDGTRDKLIGNLELIKTAINELGISYSFYSRKYIMEVLGTTHQEWERLKEAIAGSYFTSKKS